MLLRILRLELAMKPPPSIASLFDSRVNVFAILRFRLGFTPIKSTFRTASIRRGGKKRKCDILCVRAHMHGGRRCGREIYRAEGVLDNNSSTKSRQQIYRRGCKFRLRSARRSSADFIFGRMIDSFADPLFSVSLEIQVPPSSLRRPSRVLTSIKVPPKASFADGKIDGIISDRIKIAAD